MSVKGELMRRFALLCVVLVLGLVSAPAQDTSTTRVFVCTHSFMQFTAEMVPPLAKGTGIMQQTVGKQMLGGSTCIQHWNVPDDKNKVKAALTAGNVDVLTLSPYYVMPDPGIEHFTKLGLATNPELRVYVQASWPAFDSPQMGHRPKAQETRDQVTAADLKNMREQQNAGWRKTLADQIDALNKELGKEVVRLIPVNDAVFTLRERVLQGKVPGISKQSELFRDDIGHPTTPLALMVSYCHIAAIYGKSPVGIPVPNSLKDKPEAAALNTVLQEVAWEAVGKPLATR